MISSVFPVLDQALHGTWSIWVSAKSQRYVAAIQSDFTSGFARSVVSIRISVSFMFFVALSISPLSGITTPNTLNGGTGRTQSRRRLAMR